MTKNDDGMSGSTATAIALLIIALVLGGWYLYSHKDDDRGRKEIPLEPDRK